MRDHLVDLYFQMQDFMASGGPVLWAILALTILLWSLICERYWYFFRRHPAEFRSALTAWQGRRDKQSWYAQAIREAWIAELEIGLRRFLPLLNAVIAILPMTGLLGTITGMIQVFDVLAVTGTGNPRAMASGVSAATVPTMAGMVAALSGLYFATRLNRLAKTEVRAITDRISRLED